MNWYQNDISLSLNVIFKHKSAFLGVLSATIGVSCSTKCSSMFSCPYFLVLVINLGTIVVPCPMFCIYVCKTHTTRVVLHMDVYTAI